MTCDYFERLASLPNLGVGKYVKKFKKMEQSLIEKIFNTIIPALGENALIDFAKIKWTSYPAHINR